MEKTIRNCFRHAGISSQVQDGVDVAEKEDDIDDDDLPLSEWVQKVVVVLWDSMSMMLMQT
jgi:hypothetical protein